MLFAVQSLSGGVELSEGAGDVVFGGAHGQGEGAGDVLVGGAGGEEAGDLLLTGGEVLAVAPAPAGAGRS
ncbi:hypothetical protein P3T37_003095 [Kitasatospora sp. MAA4]|nr:hypothetical protein [Kitasatospora sp. MAA4]